MLVILSPSKTQDFKTVHPVESSTPKHLKNANYLIRCLKKLNKSALSQLMSLSEKLCEDTYNNIKNFNSKNSNQNYKQAIFAYTGEVFNKINPASSSPKDLSYAQSQIRILSGLYGLLKPLDFIQPYRLEMATQLKTNHGNNLVVFWKDLITETLNQDENEAIINLASKEYVNSIHVRSLYAKFITIQFKEKKINGYKVIGFFAKQARGTMVNYCIKNKITIPDQLKKFNQNGYEFNPSLSIESNWVFTRG